MSGCNEDSTDIGCALGGSESDGKSLAGAAQGDNASSSTTITASFTSMTGTSTSSSGTNPTSIKSVGTAGASSSQTQSTGVQQDQSSASQTGITTSSGQQNSNAGVTAGATIGGVALGALLGLLVAILLLRKKYRKRMDDAERQWNAERNDMISSTDEKLAAAHTLTYAPPDPATGKMLKDAQARIKTLEAERNAASSFGDKLDAKAETELLDSPKFGLSALNERVSQLAMSLTVAVSGKGQLGAGPFAQNASSATKSIIAMGPQRARDQFELAIHHAINATLYEQVCLPFCFEASEAAGRASSSATMAKVCKDVQRANDQAMSARWRSITHAALRAAAEKRSKSSTESAKSVVQQQIFNTLVELLLYTGMEADINAASQAVSKSFSRLGDLIAMLSSLMTVIREDMSTSDYYVDVLPAEQKKLTKALGLRASTAGRKEVRTLLEPVG